MGRIHVHVTAGNPLQPEHELRFDALIDTGASLLVLPSAWKERLGQLVSVRTVEVQLADRRVAQGEVCGPVKIEIEGFDPIFSEAIFLDMDPANGYYEPLVGYIVLEQAGIAVDFVGHRLLKVPYDLKWFGLAA